MFAAIAGDYDLFNHALSLNIDRLWRRRARKVMARHLYPGSSILDLCTGTGDLAIELQKIGPVTGCDFCRPMLEIAARKIDRRKLSGRILLTEGDGIELPFTDESFSAVALAFGFRNMEDYGKALEELYRVIKPGGHLMILDFSLPENRIFRRIYLFYLSRILPLAGKVLSGVIGPYQYLPASVQAFPERGEIARRIARAGFSNLLTRSLTFGIATVYLARRH